MRDLHIPVCLDEIYDALQNMIALPVPYQDRFQISYFGVSEKGSKIMCETVLKNGRKRNLKIDAKWTFSGFGACLKHVQEKM